MPYSGIFVLFCWVGPNCNLWVLVTFGSPLGAGKNDWRGWLGTAFFFSCEENWGTQRPFLASPTPPHALAALATSHQRALYFDRSLHKVTSCAELCTTSCVQYSPPIPLSTAQLPIPFSRMLHLLVALVLSSQHVFDPDDPAYWVIRHVKTCMISRMPN